MPGAAVTAHELALADAILPRHTYRDAFDPRPVPDALLERLRLAAEFYDAYLRPLTRPEDLPGTTRPCRHQPRTPPPTVRAHLDQRS